jgi:hypothetical protein
MYNVEKITASQVEFNAEHSAELEKTVLEMGLRHREEYGSETGYENWEWIKISLVGVKQIGKLDLSIKGELKFIKRLYIQKSTGIHFCIEELACMGCNVIKLSSKENFKL